MIAESVRRSAIPRNADSSPIGQLQRSDPGTECAPGDPRGSGRRRPGRGRACSRRRAGSNRARRRSRQAARVCASTPSTALTTTTTRSTTEQAARTSPKKSAYPGVSIRLILTSPTVNGAMARETDRCRFTSSGSKSETVVPSSTRPWRGSRRCSPAAPRPESSFPHRCGLRGRRCGSATVGGSARNAPPWAVRRLTTPPGAGAYRHQPGSSWAVDRPRWYARRQI